MSRMTSRADRLSCSAAAVLAAIAGAALSISGAAAQTPQPQTKTNAVALPPNAPAGYVTLQKMSRRVTIDLKDQRLEDVVTFIADVTGVEIDPMWRDANADGLDKDKRITLSVNNIPAMDLLENVLSKSQTDFQQCAWQLTPEGAIQIGPKDRLNKFKRLVIYSVQDLLVEIPNYYDAPQLDLQGVLQQSQGGGGGQSPFQDNQTQQRNPEEMERLRQERIDQIKQLITSSIEMDQWQDNGGEGGSIRFFQGNFSSTPPTTCSGRSAGIRSGRRRRCRW